jgi:hypothetical protein
MISLLVGTARGGCRGDNISQRDAPTDPLPLEI